MAEVNGLRMPVIIELCILLVHRLQGITDNPITYCQMCRRCTYEVQPQA